MKTNVWNEERRHAALKSGSISVNGYIRLGEVLEGTYEVVAMRSINEEMENCNMVFFEKKNPILCKIRTVCYNALCKNLFRDKK